MPSSPIPDMVTNNEEANHMPNYDETYADEETDAIVDEEFIAEIPVGELPVDITDEDQAAEVLEEDPAPTGPCADPKFSGYEGTEDCSGYIWCQGGVPGWPMCKTCPWQTSFRSSTPSTLSVKIRWTRFARRWASIE